MKLLLATACFLLGFTPLSAQTTLLHTMDSGTSIPVHWKADIPGDFSFAKQWSYPIGVYKNMFDQLSCDGLCPYEIEAMKDSLGKIHPDSLEAFYRFVDTTHLYHSISETAWCYEYAGTNYMDVKQISEDSFFCSSAC